MFRLAREGHPSPTTRVMRRQNVSEQEARDIIAKMDATREAYIKKYENSSRYDTRNYQLVISMDDLSEDDAAEVIMLWTISIAQANNDEEDEPDTPVAEGYCSN